MLRHLCFQLGLLSVDLDEARAFRRADSLHPAARKLPLIGHIEQPILEACRAEIGNEDFHGFVGWVKIAERLRTHVAQTEWWVVAHDRSLDPLNGLLLS